jgi:hypothetical protein
MKRILHATRLSSFSICVLFSVFAIVALAAGADSTPAATRQKLVALRGQADPRAVDIAWPYLNSTDPSVREAARLTVESQPFDSWKQRALDEKSAWGSIEALRALTEACPKAEAADLSPHICQEIVLLRVDEMNEPQQLEVLQLTRAVFSRLGSVPAEERTHIIDAWVHFPGSLTARVRAEATRLVDYLQKSAQ